MPKAVRTQQVAIPTPYEETGSLYRVALATKELVETLAGQRGDRDDHAVTWADMPKPEVPGRAPPPPPPIDDGEYVMCNGVWRLKSQTFDMAGKTTQTVTVPAWGPAQARLTGFLYTANAGGQSRFQVSGDGTTFDTGSIYTGAGFYHLTSTNGYNNYANSVGAFFVLSDTTDNPSIAMHFDAVLDLQRGGSNYVNYRVKSGAYYSTNGMVHYNFDGWVQPTTGSGLLKAFRVFTVNALTSGKVVVEWLA